MRFKKIYIEITNSCNLNCSFCNNNKRDKKFMSLEQFKRVIEEIKPYTHYVYLHVKGEPLLHPKFNSILQVCDENNIKVNITTNGTLLKSVKNILLTHKCVRQVNVSLHSENKLPTYLEDIFSVCKELSQNMYISYRLWTLNNYQLDKKSTETVEKIINAYKIPTETVEKLYKLSSVQIDFNTYVDKENLFKWPNLEETCEQHGFCYGLKTHVGILVDGTVIPCCLDGEGIINLGNIFKEHLEEILNKERTIAMIVGFKNNKCTEQLCLKCPFKNKFNKN